MAVSVRPLLPSEIELVIDYFHNASAEFLELLGVDPTRLPPRDVWKRRTDEDFALPVRERGRFWVLWRDDDTPVGFSSCDKIVVGEQANMHLHVFDPDRRRAGIGTQAVRQSAAIYFFELSLKRIFSEPNAFNVGPNRTLQAAGFKYLKTHWTVPGPLNFHQAVKRWVLER